MVFLSQKDLQQDVEGLMAIIKMIDPFLDGTSTLPAGRQFFHISFLIV
jgi:hypothetical protein